MQTLAEALTVLTDPATLPALQVLAAFYHATQPPDQFQAHLLASSAVNPAMQRALITLWEHPTIAERLPHLAVLFPAHGATNRAAGR